MLPLQYATYSWPAGAASFDIEFWDFTRRVSREIQQEFRENVYTYGASLEEPGLLLVYPRRPSGRGKPYTFPVNDVPSLSTLRWMVRMAINDVEIRDGVDYYYPEAPKWGDAEIDGYLREAIGLLNNYIQRDVIIDTTLDLLRPEVLRSLSQITQVAYYDEQQREWITVSRFSRRGPSGPRQSWDIIKGQLRFYGPVPAGAALEISGLAPYHVPANDMQPITVDRDDWDMLSIYAQGRCYLRLAGQSAQLDRWKEDGKRNDNPITPVARMLIEDATTRMKDRRGPRHIRRYRA